MEIMVAQQVPGGLADREGVCMSSTNLSGDSSCLVLKKRKKLLFELWPRKEVALI